MIYIPFTATPLGWVVLGLGGYYLYRAGKKKGEEEAAAMQITEVPADPPPASMSKTAKTKGDS